MTTMPFTCDTVAANLADHLEGDASAAVSAAITTHAAECADCRALLADIAAIGRNAAAMPALAPDRDLWNDIAERIEARVVPIAAGAARGASGVTNRSERRRWWAHPAVAAAALVGITAGVTHIATLRTVEDETGARSANVAATQPPADAGVPPGKAVPSFQVAEGPDSIAAAADVGTVPVADDASAARDSRTVDGGTARRGGEVAGSPAIRRPVPVAVSYRPGDIAALDSLYYREIVRLRAVLGQRRAQLAPTTVEVIDRNMLVIDRAIQECRAALAADPASTFLNEQLNEALESKIELLRTAAMMPVGS